MHLPVFLSNDQSNWILCQSAKIFKIPFDTLPGMLRWFIQGNVNIMIF